MRTRDGLGRFVEPHDPAAVDAVPEVVRTPQQAVALARGLLTVGRAFAAHEVFEGCWKDRPTTERDLWQGLAQVCVGLTHLQRGNPVGAVTLLRRGAGHLRGQPPSYGLAPEAVAAAARALAEQVAQDPTATGWVQI